MSPGARFGRPGLIGGDLDRRRSQRADRRDKRRGRGNDTGDKREPRQDRRDDPRDRRPGLGLFR
jgi:hypothetical protein